MNGEPNFEIVELNRKSLAINDRGKTVALVSRHGMLDWVLHAPSAPGRRIESVYKETHLCHTLGVKLELVMPGVTELTGLVHSIHAHGTEVSLVSECSSRDGALSSSTAAILLLNRETQEYEWRLRTTFVNMSQSPQMQFALEYNNVYPRVAFAGLLRPQDKQYSCTLMLDRNGAVWEFPHQHMMHYGEKTRGVHCQSGSLSGFFGDGQHAVVTIVDRATLAPHWEICDMFYDLHCQLRTPEALVPGAVHSIDYRVKRLSVDESRAYLARAQRVPVLDEDYAKHNYPRFTLGRNTFDCAAKIDAPEEAMGFTQRAPDRIWDRNTGRCGSGSLRIANTEQKENVWTAEPPTLIPANGKFNLRAAIKTLGASGNGAYIRVRYHTWEWDPAPHTEFVRTLKSPAVTGDCEWTVVALPELDVPPEHLDYLILIDFVLDGGGIAWFADVDLEFRSAAVREHAPLA